MALIFVDILFLVYNKFITPLRLGIKGNFTCN